MKKKILCLLLTACMAAVLTFAFTGCKKNDKLIKINEVTHSVFYAPLYLADALGYFDEENIEIELTNGGGADNTMAAVLSGAADIGFCGPEAAIYVAVGGTTDTPKVFGQLTKRDGSFLVGRVKEDNFDWNNLQGKNIIAGRPGGVPMMTFQYVLKEAGISANLVKNIDFNLTGAAFEGGTGDYCTMFEPAASEYQKAGKGYIVASVGQKSGEVPYTCFMAKSSYINKNGDKIEGLVRAITKAVKYLKQADLDAVAETLTNYFDATSKDSIKTSLESYKSIDAWVDNMAMEKQAFENLQNIIESAGELSRRVDFNSIVTTEIANKVYKEVNA